MPGTLKSWTCLTFCSKELYEMLHPETKHGAIGNGRVAESATLPTPRFSADTAEKTGVAERTIREEVQLYEMLHPETKRGVASAIGMNKAIGNNVSAESAPTFADDTSSKTGVSVRTIQEEVQLATNIIPESYHSTGAILRPS